MASGGRFGAAWVGLKELTQEAFAKKGAGSVVKTLPQPPQSHHNEHRGPASRASAGVCGIGRLVCEDPKLVKSHDFAAVCLIKMVGCIHEPSIPGTETDRNPRRRRRRRRGDYYTATPMLRPCGCSFKLVCHPIRKKGRS